MTTHLPFELRKFAGHCNVLRNNYRETRLATHDLKAGTGAAHVAADSGVVSSSSTPVCDSSTVRNDLAASVSSNNTAAFLELSREEENIIRRTIDARPTLVIMGTSFHAKARVLNDLFRKNVLPVSAVPPITNRAAGGEVHPQTSSANQLNKNNNTRHRCVTANADLCSEVAADNVDSVNDEHECCFYRAVRFHYRPRYACGLTQITYGEASDTTFAGTDEPGTKFSCDRNTATGGGMVSRHYKVSVASGPPTPAVTRSMLHSSESPTQFVPLSSSDERSGTVPVQLLRASSHATGGTNTIVDVGICHPLLKEGWRILVSSNVPDKFIIQNIEFFIERLADQKTTAALPIFIYAIDCAYLHAQHQLELDRLRDIVGKEQLAVFFLRIPMLHSDTLLTVDKPVQSSLHANGVNALELEYYARIPACSKSLSTVLKPAEASLLLTAPCSLSDDSDAVSTTSSSSNSGGGCCPNHQNCADMPASGLAHAVDADSGCEQQHYYSTSNSVNRWPDTEPLKVQLVKLGYLLPSSVRVAGKVRKHHQHNSGYDWQHPQDTNNSTQILSSALQTTANYDFQSNNSIGKEVSTARKLLPSSSPSISKSKRSKRKRQLTGCSMTSNKKYALDTFTNLQSCFVDGAVVGTAAGGGNNTNNSSSSGINGDNFSSIILFVRKVFQAYLVRAATTLNDFQDRCLVQFTHLAFDLSREASVLPRRLQYVKEQEARLYQSLSQVVQCRQDDVQAIVFEAIGSMREQLINNTAEHHTTMNSGKPVGRRQLMSGNSDSSSYTSRHEAAACANAIRGDILVQLNNVIAGRILEHVRYLRDSFTGTLKRCLAKLEERSDDLMGQDCSGGLPSIASLSAASSTNHLNEGGSEVEFNDDLPDNIRAVKRDSEAVHGQLRNIPSFTAAPNPTPSGGRHVSAMVASVLRRARTDSSTSSALDHILNAAYSLELNADHSMSMLTNFKQRVLSSFALPGKLTWRPPGCAGSKFNVQRANSTGSRTDDAEWRRQVAVDFFNGLSPERVSRLICQQFRDKLRSAHEVFLLSLRQLEQRILTKLERAEKTKRVIRKVHAPRLARLALESHSLRDTVLFGIPQPGRELGRGQYGVVHACDAWAGHAPCAVKSVVPPDERHRNDLALEIFYTKSVLPHPRLVQIYGSVMDYGYGDSDLASGPSVLIVMERLPRDLYHALKRGLSWPVRLQIALDVIEGIRHLHGRGFTHRDIKLKNVLLDKRWRAKLTDFGFCKPNSLISGSVVGTPIHMAPEVFNGGLYNNSVDIYAFGILYWFLCANRVRLPQAFEPWMSRDLLRSSVKRGVRPERLPEFDDDSWNLMQACWAGQPELRPLPGDIDEKLRDIQQQYLAMSLIRRSGSLTSSTVFALPASSSTIAGIIPAAGNGGKLGMRGMRRVRQRDVNVIGASTPYVELDLGLMDSISAGLMLGDADATPTSGNLMHRAARQPAAPLDVVNGPVRRRNFDQHNNGEMFVKDFKGVIYDPDELANITPT